jgi:hypothetical protein
MTRTFGPAYVPGLDQQRILTQMERILRHMSTEQWYTLAEIELCTGYPQSSISAQLRHLRKAKFGGYTIEKRRRIEGMGTWEYRLTDPRLDLGREE